MKVESTAQARELPEKEPETFAQLTSNERQVLSKRKDGFIEGAGNSVKKVDSCPKEPIPHC